MGCKKIEKLTIQDSGITQRGAMVALENLPNLKQLEYEYFGEALVLLHRRIVAKETDFVSCQLTSLSFSITPDEPFRYVSGDFSAAVALCPALTRVALHGATFLIPDQEFQDLAKSCKNLTHLDIYCPIDREQFHRIIPILENGSIESLELTVSDVDVGAIVRLCPRLRSLKLYFCDFVISSSLPRADPNNSIAIGPTQLEHLSISSSISPEDLDFLLSSPCLVTVEFSNFAPELDARVIKKAFGIHGFPRLEYLCLECCDNVTKATIDLFMTDQTRLRKLKLCNCPQLCTKENKKKWQGLIDDNNWQLELDIRPIY